MFVHRLPIVLGLGVDAVEGPVISASSQLSVGEVVGPFVMSWWLGCLFARVYMRNLRASLTPALLYFLFARAREITANFSTDKGNVNSEKWPFFAGVNTPLCFMNNTRKMRRKSATTKMGL